MKLEFSGRNCPSENSMALEKTTGKMFNKFYRNGSCAKIEYLESASEKIGNFFYYKVVHESIIASKIRPYYQTVAVNTNFDLNHPKTRHDNSINCHFIRKEIASKHNISKTVTLKIKYSDFNAQQEGTLPYFILDKV